MSRRRFYAPPGAFAPGGRSVTLAGEEARHLRDVLRLKRGDEVFVFDGEGREYRCVIEEARRDSAQLEVSAEVSPASPESPLRLTLATALLKGEKFDLVVQKATELGVARIVPVMTKLADVRLRDEADGIKRTARWQRIALEAAKQSGRARVPEINQPIAFVALIDDAFQAAPASFETVRLLFSERDGVGLIETMERWSNMPQGATALVGSEGGWTDEELASAHDTGWNIVTLGGRIMRAETAAITITALLQHLFGDLR
ncbi:MAG TPA: 16S rRNA (uracil(1498)-N(3))-methyltransferase [Pyrinomonadaceae bacterium]|jgi:16S rRNA (uracil1498-N3)-methyltransferase|nr:16S rRNA (uracil(1498)-N(3))-methyltransferase [Pyrinomonadaceae bacterium]